METGFAVIYRWRVQSDREEDFVAAWERLTAGIRAVRGGLGSRLHRGEEGEWVAYAPWPDRAAWQRAQELESVDQEASRILDEAVAERFPPLLLTPVRDLLAG